MAAKCSIYPCYFSYPLLYPPLPPLPASSETANCTEPTEGSSPEANLHDVYRFSDSIFLFFIFYFYAKSHFNNWCMNPIPLASRAV